MALSLSLSLTLVMVVVALLPTFLVAFPIGTFLVRFSRLMHLPTNLTPFPLRGVSLDISVVLCRMGFPKLSAK